MSEHVPVDEIDVEDWIDGASFTQVRVPIHTDLALYAELAPALARLEAAEAALTAAQATTDAAAAPQPESGLDEPSTAAVRDEESLGDERPVSVAVEAAALELQAALDAYNEVYARYDSAKEIWTLRALDEDEVKAIVARHPMPPAPRPLGKGANKAAQARFLARLEQFTADIQPIKNAVNEECLALGVVSVEKNGRPVRTPTIEGIRRLRRRPNGERHFSKLVAELTTITANGEVAIPAPKSLRR